MTFRRPAYLGILVVLAMALSYLERLVLLPVPGLKLGLANLVTLYALYMLGFKSAVFVTVVRSALTAMLFASPSGFVFSLTGGLLALFVMRLFKNMTFLSVFGVSVAGAAAHHIGQVCSAVLLTCTPDLFSYLALLLPASIPTGLLIALVYTLLERSLSKARLQ